MWGVAGGEKARLPRWLARFSIGAPTGAGGWTRRTWRGARAGGVGMGPGAEGGTRAGRGEAAVGMGGEVAGRKSRAAPMAGAMFLGAPGGAGGGDMGVTRDEQAMARGPRCRRRRQTRGRAPGARAGRGAGQESAPPVMAGPMFLGAPMWLGGQRGALFEVGGREAGVPALAPRWARRRGAARRRWGRAARRRGRKRASRMAGAIFLGGRDAPGGARKTHLPRARERFCARRCLYFLYLYGQWCFSYLL